MVREGNALDWTGAGGVAVWPRHVPLGLRGWLITATAFIDNLRRLPTPNFVMEPYPEGKTWDVITVLVGPWRYWLIYDDDTITWHQAFEEPTGIKTPDPDLQITYL